MNNFTNSNCPNCKRTNRDSAKYCRFCGKVLIIENERLDNIRNQSELNFYSPKEKNIIGLDEIQNQLKKFIIALKIKKQQKNVGMNIDDQNHILIFRGEAGTGKTLMASYFVEEILNANVLPSKNVVFTSSHRLKRICNYDVEISKYINENKIGILCIEDIHEDKEYLHEILLGLTEAKIDTICILIGIKEPIIKFFNEKPELIDLVTFYDFPNVSEENLLKILKLKLKLNGFIFENNVSELFLPCIKEIISKSSNNYKNAWIIEKEIIRKIIENQSFRLSTQKNLSVEELKTLYEVDIPISKKLSKVEDILNELDELIGMESVKKSIYQLYQTIINNKRRNEIGIYSENLKIHIVLTGNPGTGKTTVARLLGKLFFSMQLLPSDKVIEVDGLGMTASYVGQTKDKVSELCDKAMGGILFIDEAYYLGGNEQSYNSYGNEAVGTILKRMEDDRGKFIIIAAGYYEKMQNFMKMNPGLDSRFSYKIHIEDYSYNELCKIFELNIKKLGYHIEENAKIKAFKAIDIFCKNKDKNFANARTIRNFVDHIKIEMDSRISNLDKDIVTKEDLITIKESDIPIKKEKNITIEEVFAELNELIGLEKVKIAVKELYDTIRINKEMEKIGQITKRPEIHIVLTGNPGTGKTTVARLLSKLFFSIGLTKNSNFIETDRSKIVGKYVGHTAINMQEQCDKALGGVLFIDEVYKLSIDDYGHEATDTLMKRMEDDRGKFIVIVAGYKNRMNDWLSTNE